MESFSLSESIVLQTGTRARWPQRVLFRILELDFSREQTLSIKGRSDQQLMTVKLTSTHK